MEEFVTLNRIGVFAPGVDSSMPSPHYTLLPGMRVLIGLEKAESKKNPGSGGSLITLTEIDLDCDGRVERISGIEAPEIEYFNIHPQLAEIRLETTTAGSSEIVWEYTAQVAGVAYLAFQLFQADECNQFVVLPGHKGKEFLNVFRWDGEDFQLKVIKRAEYPGGG